MSQNILAAVGLAAFSFLCNLPLGRWRASVRKFSISWFLAVHMSVPLIIFLRFKIGLSGWFIPFTLGAAAVGQLVGGAFSGSRAERDQNNNSENKSEV